MGFAAFAPVLALHGVCHDRTYVTVARGVWLSLPVKCVRAPVPASDPATAFKPTLTVRVAPTGPDPGRHPLRGRRDRPFRPDRAGGQGIVSATETGLDHTLGPDWRRAIDTTRPLLGYVTLVANVPASTGAALIPVKDATAFRA